MFGMLSNHIKNVRKTARGVSEQDIDVLNDEFARAVSWKPMMCFGGPVTARRLHLKGNGKAVFRPTFLALLASVGFILSGGWIMSHSTGLVFSLNDIVTRPIAVIGFSVQRLEQIARTDNIYAFILGLCAFGFGLWALYVYLRPIVFNRGCGQLKKGSAKVMLKDIYAIQILAKLPIKPNYINYQMNLVLKDTRRINLFAHGNRKATCEDADKLGRFLGVPVWDMTS